jgi:hypothetical protein
MSALSRIASGTRIMLRSIGPALWTGEWRETLARWIVTLIVGSVAGTACALHPWLLIAALAVWTLAAHGVGEADEAPVEPDGEPAGTDTELTYDDVVELLWELVGDGRGVLLTALRDALHWESTREVRELLDDIAVPVRAGVRTVAGNGPGVHLNDFPPLPSPDEGDPPVAVVAAGDDANANANNGVVVDTSQGPTIIYDPHEMVFHPIERSSRARRAHLRKGVNGR